MFNDQPLSIVVDGQSMTLGMASDVPLVRAVIISLFTWRRANPDDPLPADARMGWWGDSFAPVALDRIGSRLWLLSRAKLTSDVPAKAKEYAQEALQWLVDDKVVSRIEVQAERQGLSQLALGAALYKNSTGPALDVRFSNAWDFLNV